jgi:hypothetical protein
MFFINNHMKKKRVIYCISGTLLLVIVGWTALTIFVEQTGPPKQWSLGNVGGKKALIVFDPDPFYNLDEQICLSFAEALSNERMSVKVATVASANKTPQQHYDLLIYCANTYNWRPDWAITNYIERCAKDQKSTPIVAITLGAGSTEASRKHLEKTIINSGGKLIGSYSLWLWRPNDESRMKQPNVEVAVSMAHDWGKQVAAKLN